MTKKQLEAENKKLRDELYDIHAVAEDARSERNQLRKDFDRYCEDVHMA